MKLCLFLTVYVLALGVYAQEAPRTKLHFVQTYYTGDEFKTFDVDNIGTGAEVVLTTKNPHLNYFAKGRLTTLSGSQDFLDAGVERNSSFTFYQSSFEVGAAVYPLPRKGRSFNVYLGFSGVVSYNYLALASTSLTSLKPSYQAMSTGYTGVMGGEWLLFKKFSLSAEFSQRFETAKMAGVSSFSFNGFGLAFGIGW